MKKSLESWNVDKGKSLIKRYIMHIYKRGVQLFIHFLGFHIRDCLADVGSLQQRLPVVKECCMIKGVFVKQNSLW